MKDFKYIKCKYMFMFPLQNLARKELNDALSFEIDIDALRDVRAAWQ